MKKTFKITFSIFFIASLFYIAYLNSRLYYQPHFENAGSTAINTDVLKQLSFLQRKMHSGAADDMQKVYPEGFVFMNALYGLSWCEVADATQRESALHQEALTEIQYAWNEINSAEGKSIFTKDLPVPYGAFYMGWNNYLLGKKLSVEYNIERDSAELELYLQQSAAIIHAIRDKAHPFPESYSGATWPADGTVAVASLNFKEKLLPGDFSDEMAEWIVTVKSHLDTNHLFPHSVDSYSGEIKEASRGNSQALVLNFLCDIDSVFAREQFGLYKNKFLTTRFGLPGLREFPDREWSEGDIDSGPVIFGIGGAASLVGARAMMIYGEQKTAIGLRNSIEAFGMAYTGNGEKKYLFGQIPMADAFIVWANSKEITRDKMLSTNESWRGRFQLYSLLTTIGMLLILFWMWDRLPWGKK
jgi:hypothetical protein